MDLKIPSKVVKLSLTIALLAQNLIFPQKGIRAHESSTSQHIWNVSGEVSGQTRNKLAQDAGRQAPKPFIDNTPKDNNSAEWEHGWDVDISKEESGDDVETFFPVLNETTLPAPIENKNEEEKTLQPLMPENGQKNAVGIIFSLEEKGNPTTSSQVQQVIQSTPPKPHHAILNDTSDDAEWTLAVPSRTPGDISTAQKNPAKVISTAEPIIDPVDALEAFGIFPLTEPPSGSNGTPEKPQTTLGAKRITVAPYLPDKNTSAPQTVDRQVLSGKKNPYLKSATTKPVQGLFGPIQQPQMAAKKENSPAKEEPNSNPFKTLFQRNPEGIIAQAADENQLQNGGQLKTPPKTILINFNNVNVIEYIRFISRLTNKNFVFDENDLQFNVTIISEEPTTLQNVITALIQELRIHGLLLIEQDNNFIVHKNQDVRSISRVNVEGLPSETQPTSEIVTQVFRLNILDPDKAAGIIQPMLSKQALIETAKETRNLIVTDLVSNINQVAVLIKSIDAPNSGLVIGQYVVRNAFMDTLIDLAQKIMLPIALDQPLTFVPHAGARSIFIVSSPFVVERTISVLQHLDNFQGVTRIFDLEELKFKEGVPTPPALAPEAVPPTGIAPGVPGAPPAPGAPKGAPGHWELSPQGNYLFRPSFPTGIKPEPTELPKGSWLLDPQGNWYFVPEGTEVPFQPSAEEKKLIPGAAPTGRWVLDPQGSWVFQLAPGKALQPEVLTRMTKIQEELPVGHIERTKFAIHKLQYRRGGDIVDALQSIGTSLQAFPDQNQDLIATIQSVQWLEGPNSLVLAGTEDALKKVLVLIDEVDTPARQVFIEMLILETDVDDSLHYGVTWATRSGGGQTATAQAFIGSANPLTPAINAGTGADAVSLLPDAGTLATALGFHLGVIGKRITHNGTQFATIGALVTAVHQRSGTNIILTPKIITEDNVPAEIFVGINTPFQTQSISNDLGSIITTNVEFRDVGTTLRVTPLIGDSGLITLRIEQEVSRVAGTGVTSGGENISAIPQGPTTSINRTTTTVHVPDEHFVIISGMIQEEQDRSRSQLPCLGGIPYLGAPFSDKTADISKRNLMIFIRPQIVDTAEQLRSLTRRQQEVFRHKNRLKNSWRYEVDEGLDLLNIKPPCCDECD